MRYIDAFAQLAPAIMVYQILYDLLEGNAVQWIIRFLLTHECGFTLSFFKNPG